MAQAYDLTGQKFGRLFAVEIIGKCGNKNKWRLVCDCGNDHQAASSDLVGGRIISCGCHLKERLTGEYKKCKICGKEKYVKLSHLKYEGSYCSKNCQSKSQKIKFVGDANPNYRHGQVYTSEYRLPYTQKWNRENPNKRKEFNRNAKAKRKLATGSHTANDIDVKLKEQWYECFWCFEKLTNDYEIDHIIPLSRFGSNDKENVAVSCKFCNRQKSAKLFSEWILEKNCRNKRNDNPAGKISEW